MTETIEKLDPKTDGSSMDVVQSLIDQLRPIVPEAFTEGKIDFEVLRELLGDDVDDRPERYSFNWHGKSRARRIAQTPSTGTLRPCPDESVNWDTTKNVFIEGDNLEVLKLLQKSYHKRVKMIYIDPPYNTGKEFIYPDKFQDNLDTYLKYTGQVGEDGLKISANAETGGRYHTNWLNMMYPRLKLARNLLRDDGVLFVSIDENELPNLQKLCGEIFGDENFIGLICRATGTRMGTGSRGIAREVDYLLAYSKTTHCHLNGLPMTEKELAIYDQEDEKGRYLTRSLRRTGGENRREDRPTMYYPVVSPEGDEIYPIAPAGYESRWVCGKETYEKLLAGGEIEWKKVVKDGIEKWQVYQKHYLHEGIKDASNLWAKEEGNKKATREVNALFDGQKVFDHPKPVGLMRKLIQIGSNTDDESIVLDFFAGSGSTAHALMVQNNEDNGNRRYILVQLPEECPESSTARKLGYGTISELSRERIRRAISTIDSNTAQLGFRAYYLDSSNIRDWSGSEDDIGASLIERVEHVRVDRSQDDILNELLLKFGIDLSVAIENRSIQDCRVFSIANGALVVCLADSISLETVEGIAELKSELTPEFMRVVFRDDSFADDVAKTNALQILRTRGIEDVKFL